MDDRFDPNRLRLGDVLLYRADSWISWAIRTFDNSEVSHAALYLGNDRIAEALIKVGLTTQDRSTSFNGCNWIEVQRINDTALDMAPVARVAEKYLAAGNRYAYEQIVLLGVICLTRKLDFDNPLVRSIAHRAMVAADAVIQSLRQEGKQPMICSEFVFRCYDEALPERDDPYTLEIISQAANRSRRRFSGLRQRLGMAAIAGAEPLPTVHPESLLPRLESRLASLRPTAPASSALATEGRQSELEQFINLYAAQREGRTLAAAAAQPAPAVGMEELEATAAQFARNLAEVLPEADIDGRPVARVLRGASPAARVQVVIADFVTPGDLDRSPSLTTLGKIYP